MKDLNIYERLGVDFHSLTGTIAREMTTTYLRWKAAVTNNVVVKCTKSDFQQYFERPFNMLLAMSCLLELSNDESKRKCYTTMLEDAKVILGNLHLSWRDTKERKRALIAKYIDDYDIRTQIPIRVEQKIEEEGFDMEDESIREIVIKTIEKITDLEKNPLF